MLNQNEDRARLRLYTAAVAYSKTVRPGDFTPFDDAMDSCKELEDAAVEFSCHMERYRAQAVPRGFIRCADDKDKESAEEVQNG